MSNAFARRAVITFKKCNTPAVAMVVGAAAPLCEAGEAQCQAGRQMKVVQNTVIFTPVTPQSVSNCKFKPVRRYAVACLQVGERLPLGTGSSTELEQPGRQVVAPDIEEQLS